MPKIQKLTLKRVKAAARKAYDEKRLTAQHPDKSKRECVYTSGKYGCAIGVALNATTLKKIADQQLNADAGVECLMNEDVILVSDEEVTSLSVIQTAHDKWADHARNLGLADEITREARNEFLFRIGHKGGDAWARF